MIDDTLIQNCDRVIAGLNEREALEIEGRDTTGRADVISAETSNYIQTVIATAAITLAGCAAKAALYLAMQREDLAMSLASDIISMASAATQLLAA